MKALIAMSGGVDSSVAAFLMKERGWDCVGVTMKLFANETVGLSREHTCCSLEDVEDARSVAYRLGMNHYVFNFADRFEECVIDKFIASYENGATPNPCIDCNRYLKFDGLYRRARELGCDKIVTGHYARTGFDEKTGRFLLKTAADTWKDQSYVLYHLTQDQLEHVEFPLGELTKSEVREIAEQQGFINAKKHDSQDICFVPDGDYAGFIEQRTGKRFPEGDFVEESGKVVGRHKGIIRYTVGQRKALGLSFPQPMYVKKVDTGSNTVMLCENKGLFTTTLTARDLNLISVPSIDKPMRVTAKVRYSHHAQPATVTQTDADEITVVFDEPQRAITRGQSVVMYDGDTVVGGGTIV